MNRFWIKFSIRFNFYSQEQLNCLLEFSGSRELFTMKCLTFCSLWKKEKKRSSADTKNCALFQTVQITAVTEAHHTYERRHTGTTSLSPRLFSPHIMTNKISLYSLLNFLEKSDLIPVQSHCYKDEGSRGFPGGVVVENPPANAGDTGSIPGPGRSHMPRSN